MVELFWLRQLLRDLGLFLPQPLLILCDNQSTIKLACNLVFHGRTKHIEIDFHFIRERVVHKDLSLRYVSTASQLADLLTKPVSGDRFLLLKSKLMPY